jgi:hypothetical protein
LAHLRAGDVLMIWKLDRLGRSLRHLIEVVSDLAQRGIGFKSLQERSYWIPGSWHLRMVYTNAIPFHDPSQESNRAG